MSSLSEMTLTAANGVPIPRPPGTVSDFPVLGIYAVWHPASEIGRTLARAMFRTFCANPELPASRGLGIPVRFRTSLETGVTPSSIPVDAADFTSIFILADEHLVADGAWREYLVGLASRARPRVRITPVLLTSAANLPTELGRLNGIQLMEIPDEDRVSVMLSESIHDVCQLLDPTAAKVKVFLSHAKHDGVDITKSVRDHLHAVARLDDFFDATDIPHGTPFSDFILSIVGSLPALLAVQTDSYASREWCRLEVLEAKQRHVPIVVLDAVESREPRAFPYMGNVPVIRWSGRESLPEVVSAMLIEVLRNRYFPKRVASICRQFSIDQADEILSYPPELLTALEYRTRVLTGGGSVGRILYPDPPLGTEEIGLLRQLDPNFDAVTPTTLRARATSQ